MPTEKARISSSISSQVQVCQMPRFLWRMAGRPPMVAALWIKSLGRVSRPRSLDGTGSVLRYPWARAMKRHIPRRGRGRTVDRCFGKHTGGAIAMDTFVALTRRGCGAKAFPRGDVSPGALFSRSLIREFAVLQNGDLSPIKLPQKPGPRPCRCLKMCDHAAPGLAGVSKYPS